MVGETEMKTRVVKTVRARNARVARKKGKNKYYTVVAVRRNKRVKRYHGTHQYTVVTRRKLNTRGSR